LILLARLVVKGVSKQKLGKVGTVLTEVNFKQTGERGLPTVITSKGCFRQILLPKFFYNNQTMPSGTFMQVTFLEVKSFFLRDFL
jgi:hypothetical protein